MSVDTAGISADNADTLVFTGCYTAAAKDTFVVISYHMCGGVVKLINGLVTVEFVGLGNAVFKAELLKLTVTASDTLKALSFVS